MKRFWRAGIIALFCSAAWSQTTTSITGTIKDLTQALVTSGQVTFTLTPSRDTTISGIARFSPNTVTCLINASGQITNLSGGTCTVTMNTALNPPGSYYLVGVWPYGVKTSTFTFYAVLSNYDWSTVVPTPTTSPAQNFVDVFSNQTVGGNKVWQGTQTWQGAQTFSGAATFSSLATGSGGFAGSYFSTLSANPAQSGIFRMAYGDALNVRNQANNADLTALQDTAGDILAVGGANGISASAATIPAVVANTVTGQAGVAMTITGTAPATSINGPSLTITAGNAGLGGSHAGGALILGAGGSSGAAPPSTIQLNSKIGNYQGNATYGNGVPAEFAGVDLISQTAAITTTTLYTVSGAGAFGPSQFRLTWNAKVTTAAGTSSTLGGLTITYVDPDGVTQTITAGALSKNGAIETTDAGNSTTTVLLGVPLMLNCQTNSTITYAFAYASNAANAMTYNLHVRLEAE